MKRQLSYFIKTDSLSHPIFRLFSGLLLLALSVTLLSTSAHANILGPFAGSWDGTESVQTDRLFRNAIASDCTAGNKTFPGTFSSGTELYESFAFTNNAAGTDCITIDVTVSSVDTHFSLYLNSYDPTDFSLNYLGDIGSSQSQPFSVLVPGASIFVVVANTNFGSADAFGETFSFTVSGSNVSGGVVPEPTSIALLGLGLAGLGLWGRKRMVK